MEQFLIERDTLVKIIDALLSQKYPDEPPANIDEIREDSIHKLDNQIGTQVFSSLNEKQLKEINNLLDDQEKDPAVFQNFFQNAGVNLEQKITEAIQGFSQEFLGGKDV